MITTRQAAARLGVTAAMVQRYCRKGRIRANKFGAAWLIEPAAVSEFARSRRKPGRPKTKKQA